MQIVICDDDEGVCVELERWINEYGKREKTDIDIEVFNSAEDLLIQIQNGFWFDAIFLDIEFSSMNGVEMGRRIRQSMEWENVGIVYISAKTQYCQDLFAMEPMNFHQKPLVKDEVEADLEKLIRRYSRGRQVIRYTDYAEERGILLRDVVYIEAGSKRVTVNTVKGEKIVVKDTISHIQERYQNWHMCRCHRSYLVNLYYVERYGGQMLLLRDGIEIPIGRKYVEQVKKAWMDYDREGAGC
jgi:DNA-binding LytR/AlgR family response regulator